MMNPEKFVLAVKSFQVHFPWQHFIRPFSNLLRLIGV